jgi:cytochrome c-type biogenesis protein CcmE
MTRKRKRLVIVLASMAALGIGAALVLSAFRDNLVFFYSPTEVTTKHVPPERRFRVGGLVEEQSVKRGADGVTVTFRVTDMNQSLKVSYRGVLPDLFREGQGVVAEGKLDSSGMFQASEVLAKHDERYMPPEVVKALKQSGKWQEGAAQ